MRDDAAAPARRFPLVPFDQIALHAGSPYLVRGLIPRDGLVVIWGAPKSGKTFWTFDLAMHVALGWSYRDRRVAAGAIVYIACEGERGLAARAEAFRRERMTEESGAPPFYLLTTRLDLAADASLLIADLKAQLPNVSFAAIVIDTLNRSIGGSESSDEDMGAYIKAADAVREAFSCTIIVIHHCGIDDRRPRGHTSLAGAADAQIAVKREDEIIVATVEFMKDGEPCAEIRSTLRVVELGNDDEGEPITSCVIEATDAAPAPRPRKAPITGAAKVALDLLRRAIDEAGEVPPASNHIPDGKRAVREEMWRRYAYEGSISAGSSEGARRKAYLRAATHLQTLGAVGTWNGWVWFAQ